jgi:hypothetical protein
MISFWVLPVNQVFPASIVAYATCFALTMWFLRGRIGLIDRFFISSATMVSGIWLYELVYHYCFFLVAPIDFVGLWNAFLQDLAFISVQGSGGIFPLVYAVLIICLPMLARKYMSLNRYFALVLFASLVLFGMWVWEGYSQYIYPQWLTGTQSKINYDLMRGYIFNSLTKMLAVLPALLFYKRRSMEAKVP